MRTFEKTHPWINFQVNLGEASHRLWMLLGEAQSKCRHIAGVPLLPEVATELHKVYLAKGVHATTAIEGNTLTEKQVRQRSEGKFIPPPSGEYLVIEIDNTYEAYNLIVSRVMNDGAASLSPQKIQEYNRLILRNCPLDEDVVPGVIRDYPVGVGRYQGAPPEDCEFLVEKLCSFLNEMHNPLPHPERDRIAFGILKAIIAHVYLAWIHPFGDGNGRTARLIEYEILFSVGIPVASAHLLSNHYNLTRAEYYRQLDQTSQTQHILPFIEYALQGFVDQLGEQIEWIEQQQIHVHWMNHIHETFREENSVNIRLRALMLALTKQTDPVAVADIPDLTRSLGKAYAGRSDKTLQRDIARLKAENLIVSTPDGIIANQQLMRAFLSPTRPTRNIDS